MRAVIQAASGKAEEEPIVVLLATTAEGGRQYEESEPIAPLSATTTTKPVVAWAPIRAAEGLRDTAYRSSAVSAVGW
jgi:hypothetical protein